jgi:hypothetical protein
MFIRTSGTIVPQFFRDAADANAGAAEPGNDETGTSTEAPDIEKIVAEAVAAATAGLKKKNEELIGKEKALKTELSAVKAKPALSDEEFTEYTTIKGKLERDALLRDLADGKSEDVIERLTRRTRLELEAKVAAEAEQRTAKEAEAAQWRNRYEQTLIDVEVTRAAAALVKPAYQDLVLKLVGEKIKLVDGAVRVVNDNGDIEMTANGARPLAVADYIESLRTNYGDLFVTSAGGGAGGSGKKTPGTSRTVSMELAGEASMEDYVRMRREGKII